MSPAKYLLIVESSSKCSKIESYLGSQYKCIACNGHFRCIDGLKSINTKQNYEPTFTLSKDKQKHVEYMKTILLKFSNPNIILATDDDREGEAIAWHVCDTFGLSVADTPRIKFNEITKSAILRAAENPVRIDMRTVYAQHARQVLDLLIGYKISPLLWKYLYNDRKNGLSAGRCQTPALRLVYENEMTKSIPTTSYKTRGKFTSKNIDFTLSSEFVSEEEARTFIEKTVNFKHFMTLGTPTESTRGPPKPFNTSRLLQHASHLSPKETMSMCQILYQEGYITYMRTDSTKYSKEFLSEAKMYIGSKWGDKYIGLLDKLENIDKSNPHEAIRVTKLETTDIANKSDTRIATLYKMIWRNTLESCMSDAKCSITECRLTAPDDLYYKHMIEVPLFSGWQKHNETESQNGGSGMALYFKSIIGKPIQYSFIESTVTFQHKHSHYNETGLISKLEDLGIGRPSTFASLVDVIQERGYVKKTNIEGNTIQCSEYKLSNGQIETLCVDRICGNEKNKLVIQPVGILIIEFLIQTFGSIFSYDYTDKMEQKLDKIALGEIANWYDVCKEYHVLIKSSTNAVAKETYKIDDSYYLVFTKNGPALSTKTEDGAIDYKSVKKDISIDLDKLKKGEYKLDDLLEPPIKCIGQIGEHDVYIKHGPFGTYAEWGDNKKSVKNETVTIKDLERLTDKSPLILRALTDDLSIRKGKYGAYAHYQRKDMPKPIFYNIKKFREGFSNCKAEILIDWLCETYNIPKMSSYNIE